MERVRSWLFSPADRPDRCRKALSTPADQVIWDLEDGVGAAQKELAREYLVGLLHEESTRTRRPWVRINAPRIQTGRSDVARLVDAGLDRFVIPKVDAQALSLFWAVVGERSGVQALCLVESARGLLDLLRIGARSPFRRTRNMRLAFGSLDYSEDLGLARVALRKGSCLRAASSYRPFLKRARRILAEGDADDERPNAD